MSIMKYIRKRVSVHNACTPPAIRSENEISGPVSNWLLTHVLNAEAWAIEHAHLPVGVTYISVSKPSKRVNYRISDGPI